MRKTAGALSSHGSLWGMDERMYISDILSLNGWVFFVLGWFFFPVEVCQHSVPERWGPKKVWSKYLELYLYKMRSVKMNRVPSPVLQEQSRRNQGGNLYLFLLRKGRKIKKKHCLSNARNQSFSTRLLCVLFSSSSATFPTVHCWGFLFFIFATHAHTSVAHVWSTDKIFWAKCPVKWTEWAEHSFES